jgi:GNAT superfamily N-acetyltransferase
VTDATDARLQMLRPMRASDVPVATAVSLAAFGASASREDPTLVHVWSRRVGHCLETDPAGAFVAERDGRVAGVAAAIRRDRTWILSLLAVDPSGRGHGLGGALLSAALEYENAGDAGLIVGSNDPHALRAYGLAGFELRPTFEARGAISLEQRPADLPDVSDGAAAIADLSEISRDVRGASHELDLPHALERGARILRLGDRGFAVAQRGRGVWLLAARDEATATALLWHGLAEVGSTDGPAVRWITAEQQWAIEVALRAGLRLVPYGALCVRRVRAPIRPYLPSASFA